MAIGTSEQYSKVVACAATGSFLLWLLYYKYVQNEGRRVVSSDDESAQRIGNTMLAKMRETERVLSSLQREIFSLRRQLEETEMQTQESLRQLSDAHVRRQSNAFSTASRPLSIVGSALCDACSIRSGKPSYINGAQSDIQASPTVRFSKPTVIISSKHMPDPASDDDIWRTPDISRTSETSCASSRSDEENVCDRQLDARLETMATHCVDSLASLGSLDHLGPDYVHVAMDVYTYTPLPSSHLPARVASLISEMDHISYNLQSPCIEADVEDCWNMLMDAAQDVKEFMELTWRTCRAAVYLRTVYQVKKDSKRARYFTKTGLEYAEIGMGLLESTPPYNITDPEDATYNELRVTALSPMIKWAGSCVGVAAEIAPGVSEKIKYGFQSRDSYKRAVELDPHDFYTYYCMARWHWEIYKLPSLLKRSANWVSPEPFNSTVDDTMHFLKLMLEKFPQKYPFLHRPPDCLVLMAQCLLEKKNKVEAKAYAIEAKENLVKLFGNTLGLVDQITKKEIEDVLKHV